MEYLDIVDEQGQPTGEIVSRTLAHTKGIRHRTAHIWIVRRENEHFQVLMQKRAMSKDSFPGKYDTSSAGHIQAGDEPLASGLRELAEELGIHAKPEDLEFAGCIHGNFAEEFHGKIFRDNEIAFVYIYQQPVDIETLVLQKEEVESVRWFDLEETYQNCRNRYITVFVAGSATDTGAGYCIVIVLSYQGRIESTFDLYMQFIRISLSVICYQRCFSVKVDNQFCCKIFITFCGNGDHITAL